MKKNTIVTHNGSYHADDLFAVAALSLFLEADGSSEKIEIIRTRDENIIKTADYVVDVGGIYDEASKRFDHHQKGGAGARANTIPYASFGLVWKFCGKELCGGKDGATAKTIAEAIDKKLVSPIDANDNGVELSQQKFPEVSPYLVQNFFYSFRPTWKEDASIDDVFLELVPLAKTLLSREIKKAVDEEEGKVLVEKAYMDAEDKRLVILDQYLPWQEVLMKYRDPLYVVFPEREGSWGVKAVGEKEHSFVNRKDFPAAWAGKRDKELADITGVPDAIFCHNALFTCYAKSREGAIALAKLAIEA